MIVLNFCKKMFYLKRKCVINCCGVKILQASSIKTYFLRIFKNLYKECSQDLSEVRYLKGFLKFMQGSSKIFTKIHNDLQGSSKIC